MHLTRSRVSRRPRAATAALAALAALTGLAGCTQQAAPSSSGLSGTCLKNAAVPLVLAVGVRSNVPVTQFPAAVNALLETAARGRQQITLIRIDGQPKALTPAPFASTAQNPAALTQAVNGYLSGVIGPLLHTGIHAQVPQADVLSALSLAAAAAGPGGNIIVVDSGLQTVAPLQYQDSNLMMSPPGDLVSFLRSQHLLPDLSGRHVLLSGFGYAASPQLLLNQAQRDNVTAQWEAIVRAGGGCVTADPSPNTQAELAGLPAVSVVTPPQTPAFAACGTIALSDAGSVGFDDGSATFRQPAAARSTLSRLAAPLKPGSAHLTLIGSTSTEGGDALNNPLSLARANAVKGVLQSLGIAASRISTVGDGSHWPGRVPDIGPGGELLPGPAEQDREVIVQLPKCT